MLENLRRTEPLVLANGVKGVLLILATFGIVNLGTDTIGFLSGQLELAFAALYVLSEVVTTIWARSKVGSPQTLETLAKGVRSADVEGTVPYVAAKKAKTILEGAAETIVPVALTAALRSAGLPPDYAARVGVEAAQQAARAVQEARKRPLTPQEGEAALNEQIARRKKIGG